MAKKLMWLSLILGSSLMLTACSKDPVVIEAEKFKKSDEAIQSYKDYINAPEIGEDKSAEEVVQEMLDTDLGINSTADSYNVVGIAKGTSNLVKSIIIADKPIPTSPNISAKDFSYYNESIKENSNIDDKDYKDKQQKMINNIINTNTESITESEDTRMKKYFAEMYTDMQENVGKDLGSISDKEKEAEEQKKNSSKKLEDELESKEKSSEKE